MQGASTLITLPCPRLVSCDGSIHHARLACWCTMTSTLCVFALQSGADGINTPWTLIIKNRAYAGAKQPWNWDLKEASSGIIAGTASLSWQALGPDNTDPVSRCCWVLTLDLMQPDGMESYLPFVVRQMTYGTIYVHEPGTAQCYLGPDGFTLIGRSTG